MLDWIYFLRKNMVKNMRYIIKLQNKCYLIDDLVLVLKIIFLSNLRFF